MPLNTYYQDITELQCDVIVNSLGKKTWLLGGLCQNILHKAQSQVLMEFINGLKTNQVNELDMFETGGGALPCAHILHIVTPTKANDNDDCELLESAYAKVLDYAIAKGYGHIGIPLIGTGANGYNNRESYEAAVRAVSKIMTQEEREDRDIIQVSMVFYLESNYEKTEIVDYCMMESSEHRGRRSRVQTVTNMTQTTMSPEELRKQQEREQQVIVRKFKRCANALKLKNMDDYIRVNDTIYYPYDFLVAVLNKRGILESKMGMYLNIDKNKKYKLKHKETFSKREVFACIGLLEMTPTAAAQFMLLNGICPRPNDEVDEFMMDYLEGKYVEESKRMSFTELSKVHCKEYIDIYDYEKY